MWLDQIWSPQSRGENISLPLQSESPFSQHPFPASLESISHVLNISAAAPVPGCVSPGWEVVPVPPFPLSQVGAGLCTLGWSQAQSCVPACPQAAAEMARHRHSQAGAPASRGSQAGTSSRKSSWCFSVGTRDCSVAALAMKSSFLGMGQSPWGCGCCSSAQKP